jgi:hypothetical protein
MHLKPPIIRAGRPGWVGRQATRLKCLAVIGAVALGIGGGVLVATTPASADPAFQFVQVGSDTTENVMDYFTGQIAGGVLASYDAVNPQSQNTGEIITPAIASATVSGGSTPCSFTRPNGSGQGFKTLDYSYTFNTAGFGGLSTGLAENPQPGCVTISRSSSGPGSVTSGTCTGAGSSCSTGNFVYVPFAIDAVTYATGPTTAISETTLCTSQNTNCTDVGTNGNPAGIGTVTFTTTPSTISQTADFSVAQLQMLYGSCSSVTVGSTTYDPEGSSFAFTATDASPAVFTASGSAFTAGQIVTLGAPASPATLPGGFSSGVSYYVVSPSGDTFELALSPGGTAIASTSTGSGTVVTPGTIDLYAPQNGSGTLSFWETSMGVSSVQPCWHQTIVAGPAIGVSVEEHDGSALASDPIGIAPISIAKWIGMNNGDIIPDVRHGDILQSITVSGTPVVPINSTGSMNISGCLATGGTQSACFPITREVYNVMPYYMVTNTAPASGTINNPAFNATLAGLFIGTGSTLCKSTFTIAELGFGNMPSSNSAFTDICGASTTNLRVQMNASSTQG